MTRSSDKKRSGILQIREVLNTMIDEKEITYVRSKNAIKVLNSILDNMHIFTHNSDCDIRRSSLTRFRITVLKKCSYFIDAINKRTEKTDDDNEVVRLSQKLINALKFGYNPGPKLTRFTIN